MIHQRTNLPGRFCAPLRMKRLLLTFTIALGLNLSACAGPTGFTFGPRPVTPMTSGATLAPRGFESAIGGRESEHGEREGEAPGTMPLEGATLAPRMDDTHEEGFKMPNEEEEKENIADKAGMTLVAVVVVAVSIASAVAIPLLLANK